MALLAHLIPLANALPSLRIMPLGDSITKGSLSTGTVGYRAPLRQKLVGLGASVDMIGSLKHGNMIDSDHEGHSGETLVDISKYWKLSIKAKPNVVLVHAGTNNMDLNEELNLCIGYMQDIIDGIFQEVPGVTILVAPVIWANKPAMQANTDVFNPQVEDLIRRGRNRGTAFFQYLSISLSPTSRT